MIAHVNELQPGDIACHNEFRTTNRYTYYIDTPNTHIHMKTGERINYAISNSAYILKLRCATTALLISRGTS